MLGYTRRHFIFASLATASIVTVSWLAVEHFVPAPPNRITIATSFAGGHYQALGQRYQAVIERSHLAVDLRATDGAVENLKLLNDPASAIQIAFVQGGISSGKQSPDLLSLGRIDYQVFWLFHRVTDSFEDITQLKGKRIALGPSGSGTRAVSEKILGLGGINYDNTTLTTLAAQGAVNALAGGSIDALFLTFAPNSPILQSLLVDPQFKPMNFADAGALTRIFPFLVQLTLPRSVIDYEKKIPSTDVTLIATTNAVLIRKDLHPGIVDLLAKTIMEVHADAGLFHRVGDFPTLIDPEFPMAESARDFYRSGPSFLNRYFPFWMTSYVQRIVAVLATVIAIVVPLFNYAPKAFRWLVEVRLSAMYRRLRAIEAGLRADLSASDLSGFEADLDSVDRSIQILGVPMQHSDLYFSIKSHLDLVRARLLSHKSNLRVRIGSESVSS